jgi:hypothetical protein
VTFMALKYLIVQIIVHSTQVNLHLLFLEIGSLAEIWRWKFVRNIFGRNGVL